MTDPRPKFRLPDTDMVNKLGLDVRAANITRKQLAIAGAGLVAVVILLVWMFSGSKPAQYITAPVTEGPLSVTVSATGTLSPRTQVDVGSEVSGHIDALFADYNDHVTKGQTLAKINTDQLKAQLDQARAALAQARATLVQDAATVDRYARLRKSNAVSPQELDNATGDYGRAKAGVASAAAQVSQDETLLTKATIFSPIDGVVLDKKVAVGQTLVAAMTTPVLFTIASDLSQMELDVDIDEADVGSVHQGLPATFTVDAYPNRQFSAKVVQVRNAAQTTQGVVTYKGVLLVQNPELLLKPGMTATATIVAARIDKTLQVPNAALRFLPSDVIVKTAPPASTAANAGRVWTVNGKTLKAHDLRLGATDGHFTQVVKGDLSDGEAVVTDSKTSDGPGR